MNEEIKDANALIDRYEKKLPVIADSLDVLSGSVEIDVELHKLGTALRVLTRLIYVSGKEEARLKNDYYKKKYELAIGLNKEKLDELGIVKSNKFEFIKSSLYNEMKLHDEMSAMRRRFENTFNTYQELIMIYKKTRTIPAGE
jgi:hypothetical protein